MLFLNIKQKLFFFCIQKTSLFFLKSNLIYFIYKLQNKSMELEAWITPWNIYPCLTFLNKQTLYQSNLLIDIQVYDVPKIKQRFYVIYSLLSTQFNYRFSLITKTSTFLPLISVTSIFKTSNWIEREVWDLFGIFFLLHNDLRRILTEYGFNSHPLRKDFPVTGFLEMIYDDSKKQIVSIPLELSQKYRYFNFNSTWSKY